MIVVCNQVRPEVTCSAVYPMRLCSKLVWQNVQEAWERYVQDQWGPMLKALGASGTHAPPGQGAGPESLGLPASSAAAMAPHRTGERVNIQGAGELQDAQPAGNQQALPQEDGLWASLAAHALQEASARTAQHTGRTHEQVLRAPDGDADSDSSEEIDIMGLPSTGTELEATFSSLCLKHPWDEQAFCSSAAQEPLTFSSVGVVHQPQHQRMRRVVRVVRSARPPASKASSGETTSRTAGSKLHAGLKEALLSSPASSSPEPSSGSKMGRHDPSQRTRKKRAAATLMEGTSTFHAPPAATGKETSLWSTSHAALLGPCEAGPYAHCDLQVHLSYGLSTFCRTPRS